MELAQQVNALAESVAQLNERDASFARDLISNYNRKGLSTKQANWIVILLHRASGVAAKPAPEVLDANVKRVFDLFATARASGLKFPKIKLRTSTGNAVAMQQAGERSKYAGQVMLTDGGRYPDNTFYGTINAAGELAARDRMTADVRELVNALAANPEAVVGEHGKHTGQCCLCNRPLTDARSTAVGYGPICADRYGLAWG